MELVTQKVACYRQNENLRLQQTNSHFHCRAFINIFLAHPILQKEKQMKTIRMCVRVFNTRTIPTFCYINSYSKVHLSLQLLLQLLFIYVSDGQLNFPLPHAMTLEFTRVS